MVEYHVTNKFQFVFLPCQLFTLTQLFEEAHLIGILLCGRSVERSRMLCEGCVRLWQDIRQLESEVSN